MSVRHIHAKPGQYIAVHRSGGRRSSGGSGGDSSGMGCLALIGIFLFFYYLTEILTLLAVLAILFVIGWLIFTFRREIWIGIKWIICGLWKVAVWGYRKLRELVLQMRINQTAGKKAQSQGYSQTYTQSEYGRIIQRRK